MRLRSESGCSLVEFTDIMHKLLKAAWGDDWGTFSEEYPNGKDPTNVELPMITYTVLSKVPGTVGNGDTKELKPRLRDVVARTNVPDGEPELMNIYGAIYDHQIIFTLWADNNTAINELADRFEEFMMIYTGYFLQRGVQKLIFQEMTSYSEIRMDDQAAHRNFRYLVRLEKQVAVPTAVIKEVIGRVEAITGAISIADKLPNDQDQPIEAIEFRK